ncbi:N-acetylglucosamine-binding protein GbpA [Vibrio intestinalis]|uniref:N-acetylglucosamine-binding protein GbpA n=1 Tax=Vibrio intestinalis TaxID=2933291 RepID=UPI0021A28046|nr:N-acetylglucosamine-binding protein GbpA [Vibrio intestinalis]
MRTQPNKTLIALALATISGGVMAHGYVSEYQDGIAAGRAALCKFPTSDTNEKNSHCGAIQYEPQSVEGPDGFPETGPVDGKIASAQTALAAALDEQTSDRWVKRPIQSGSQTFEWTFTANHVTKDWKYYITKADWNPNALLTRDSFDLNPFCVIDGNMVQPPKQVSHQCQVPEREGYQVILAVWDVGDTAASFYNVIDVQFDGQGPVLPDWNQVGQISPSMGLNIGDTVYTRVFDQSGENLNYRTELTIDSTQLTQAKNWSHALASKINQQQTLVQAGQYSDGKFTPVYGNNPLHVKANSGLKSIEIGYDIDIPAPDYSLTIDGLEAEYVIDQQPTELALTLTVVGDQQAELTVYNHGREPLASWSGELVDGQYLPLSLTLSKSEQGHHILVSRIKDKSGNLIDQQNYDFHLIKQQTPPPADDYDFVFPASLDNYSEGTKVLAADGSVYQCKAFPYSGYCVQWSDSANQFEPGVGSHWSMAWDKIN